MKCEVQSQSEGGGCRRPLFLVAAPHLDLRGFNMGECPHRHRHNTSRLLPARTVKNDCALTHAVMTSTCAPILFLRLPFPTLTSHSPPIPPPFCLFPFSFLQVYPEFQNLTAPFTWLKKKSLKRRWPLTSTGEREEVHAAAGQPEGPRRGEKFHVKQAHILHLQHRVQVCWKHLSLSFFLPISP